MLNFLKFMGILFIIIRAVKLEYAEDNENEYYEKDVGGDDDGEDDESDEDDSDEDDGNEYERNIDDIDEHDDDDSDEEDDSDENDDSDEEEENIIQSEDEIIEDIKIIFERVLDAAKKKNICKLPTLYGNCNGNILRYGYSEDLKSCILFFWSGCGGNANKFSSQSECEEVCGNSLNLLIDEQRKNQSGSVATPKINATRSTGFMISIATAVQKVGDFHSVIMILTIGIIIKNVTKEGEKDDKDDDDDDDSDEDNSDEDSDEDHSDEEDSDEDDNVHKPRNVSVLKNKSLDSPIIFKPEKDHIISSSGVPLGDDNDSDNRNHNNVTKGEKDPCNQPKVIGFCKGKLSRYFYNKKTKTCKKFYYRGCGGNNNKFKSKEKCAAKCISK